MTSADPAAPEIWPTEVRLIHDKHALQVSFDDGSSFTLPAEYLRVESPSAEVQGHAPHEKITVPGKRAVRIVAVEPVGSYAVRLGFDDGHGTGLYTWPLLRTLGLEQETRFAAYLEALQAQGLSRG
ncbi:gamma-butyrobetaine hydroxylase family protein [Roseixanthobacter glucoisosaccharinicivorans]|uniref:gamma-butyrobetaine hydroxylase-like domain-containing protein n=1 Tax=Roseixanthobacter glucoisosaccharinicivorans TaxID=3119923 RepID=UPI0037298E5C